MGEVISSASMSVDGYIAKDDNTIGRLFDWLQNGPVEIPTVSDIHHSPPESGERRVHEEVARRAGRAGVPGVRCSTSPTGGAEGTRCMFQSWS